MRKTKNNYQLIYTNKEGKKIILETSEFNDLVFEPNNIVIEEILHDNDIMKMKQLYNLGFRYDMTTGKVFNSKGKEMKQIKQKYLFIQHKTENTFIQVYQHKFIYWYMNRNSAMVNIPKLSFKDNNQLNLKYDNIILYSERHKY